MLMPRGLYYQAALRWPHMFLTLCPTYLGIAQAAFDFTVAYLRGEVPGAPPGAARARARPSSSRWARCASSSSRRRRSSTARSPRRGSTRRRTSRLRAYAAQYTVMEHANDICRLAVRTCGGRSIMKSMPLERLYRDSRCGSLMLPWTAEICLERLGRESLFEPGERD